MVDVQETEKFEMENYMRQKREETLADNHRIDAANRKDELQVRWTGWLVV